MRRGQRSVSVKTAVPAGPTRQPSQRERDMPGSLCAGRHDAGIRKPGPEWGGVTGALFLARFSARRRGREGVTFPAPAVPLSVQITR